MTKQAMTPGDWVIGFCSGDCKRDIFIVCDNERVAAALAIGSCDEQEANAKAIAALPDLVAALQACVNRLEIKCAGGAALKTRPVIVQARTALRKAGVSE